MKLITLSIFAGLFATSAANASYYCVAKPNSNGRSHKLGSGYGDTKSEAAAAAIKSCRVRNHSERYCTINYCVRQSADYSEGN